ncbi:MAG TPA: hypothetical protein VFS97_00140, partial [Nitrososphaeraceae archaeon]|nr:hypothetical protein [Nitrososphaeraceae archaeon]
DDKHNIAIFDTFKTRKDKFTGEAKRQRGIIAHLAVEQSPEFRTRTSIAHVIAKKHGILWQNIYSGIFRDLEEALIPSGVIKEGGRLPLRRGPRALQLEGVPFYELTETGLLVASSIEEIGDGRIKILEKYLGSLPTKDNTEDSIVTGLLLLIKTAPSFVFKIVNEYIYAYSIGLIDNITPLDIIKLRAVISKQVHVEKELIEAFIRMENGQRDIVKKFFSEIG